MSKSSSNIGQHLFIGFAGKQLGPDNRRLLNSVQPGGVILFARNIGSAAELQELTRSLRTELAYRPLVAIDQENARVNRLRDVIGEIPTIDQLKQAGVADPVEEFGRTTGRWLHQFGVDIDFAPVFDLELFDERVDNALRDRCWGKTADEVIQWAGAFLEGLEREGVTGCPKHFPGLGGSKQDSHEVLPTITRSREQLLTEDLLPYSKFLRRLSMLMISHGHFPAFDPAPAGRPATLSRAIMTDLLRTQMGYTGLAVTDDMEMGAVSRLGSFGEAIVESFHAGADMMLICHSPDRILSAHEAMTKAVEAGKITRKRLAESQSRIQQFRDEWIAHKG